MKPTLHPPCFVDCGFQALSVPGIFNKILVKGNSLIVLFVLLGFVNCKDAQICIGKQALKNKLTRFAHSAYHR